jgi:hypothetical protein
VVVGRIESIEQSIREGRAANERMRGVVSLTQNAGNAVIYRREIQERTGCLLPRLKAPNDDETIDFVNREKAEQRRKNRKFREYLARKEREAAEWEFGSDDTDVCSISSSNPSRCSELMTAEDTGVTVEEAVPLSEAIPLDSRRDGDDSEREWADQTDASTQTPPVQDLLAEPADTSIIPVSSPSEPFDLKRTEQARTREEPDSFTTEDPDTSIIQVSSTSEPFDLTQSGQFQVDAESDSVIADHL